ncbi:MAG: enoyl-CoA hydratase [Actinomycetia bacterium]|nr:enoyl-CoA hydratase [Actinomycetes bacterium]
MSEILLSDSRDGVATVTLNRPGARNALDAALRAELHTAMADLEADPTVAAVVLTGSDPAFCAGLDLKELAGDPSALSGGRDQGFELRRPIPTMQTPVIGAINGVAITGGFELALACDFLVASEHARFADTHARVGIMPGWGLTVNLAEAVGVRRAKELSATGNFLDATTACEWGLVNHVVPHEELMAAATRLARDVAEAEPAAVQHVLATYDAAADCTRAEAFQMEARRSGEWLTSRGGGDLDAARKAVTERGRRQV